MSNFHVFSHSNRKTEDALRLGAHYFHTTSTNPEIFEQYKHKLDLIINSVSNNIDWNSYIQLLNLDGAIVGSPWVAIER